MSPGADIRPANEADAVALAAILESSGLHERYGSYLPPPERAIGAALAAGGLYVACWAGEAVGFVWLECSGTFGSCGYIRLIVVDARKRKAGVGRALMQFAEDRIFEHARHAFLLTSDFNDGAQGFYDSLGWKRVGAVPGFLAPDISEIIYWKPRPTA